MGRQSGPIHPEDQRGSMKNSFWLALQFFVSIIISFVTLKLNLLNFGGNSFGYWLSIAAVWNAALVIDAGFSASTIVLIAEAQKKGATDEVKRICSTSLCFYCSAGLVLFCAATAAVHLLFAQRADDIALSHSSFIAVNVLLGFSFLFQYLHSCIRCFFEGIQNFLLASKIAMAYNVILLALILAVSVRHGSLVELSFAYAAASFMLFCCALFLFQRHYQGIRLSRQYVSFSAAGKIIRIGGSYQLSSLFGVFIDPVIKYVIGTYQSLSYVSTFEIARRFTQAISGLFFASFRTILPRASQYDDARGFHDFLSSDIQKVVDFSHIYSGLFFGVSAALLWPLFHFWFSSDAAFTMYLIIALPEIINILSYPFYISLIGKKLAHIVMVAQLINLAGISLSIILGYRLLHSNLVLLSYFAIVMLSNGLIFLYYKYKLNFNILAVIRRTIVFKMACLAAILLAGVFLTHHGYSFYAAALVSAAACIVFLPAAYGFCRANAAEVSLRFFGLTRHVNHGE